MGRQPEQSQTLGRCNGGCRNVWTKEVQRILVECNQLQRTRPHIDQQCHSVFRKVTQQWKREYSVRKMSTE